MTSAAKPHTTAQPGRCVSVLVLVLSILSVVPVRAQTVPGREPAAGPADRADRLGTVLESGSIPGSWWTDGYSLRLPGSPLSGPLGPPPAVYVDGLVMPFIVLDRLNTGIVPVSTIDITDSSLNSNLHLSPDGRARHGSLDLATNMPEGTSLRGSVVVVNDTGDPGPNLYRGDGRNVDRSGPRVSVRASVNEGPWFVQGALDTDEHHMTDRRIVSRIRSVFDAPVPPVIRVLHPHARVRFDDGLTLVDVRAGRSTTDDFMFMDAFAREWTNRQTWTWLSARAVRPLDEDWTAEVAVSGRKTEIASRSMPFDPPMPLSLGTGSAEATLVRNWPTGTTSIRAGLMTEDASQATQIARVEESRGFAGLGWRSALSNASRLNLDARVSHPINAPLDPSTASSAALLELTSRFRHIGLSGGVTVSSERRAPLSSLSELAAAGFDAGDLGPRIYPAPLRTRERIAETHVRIESGGSDPASLTGQTPGVTRWLELRLRRSRGLTILENPITRIRDVSSTSEPRYVSGISGSAWHVMAGVAWRPPGGQTRTPGGLRVRMAAYAGGSSTQSDVYRTWYSGPPRYAVQIDVGWSANRIGLDVSSRIEGPGRWRMYARTPSAYRPARTRIDAAVWKRVGGEAALLTLGIRNLLDTPYLIHPAGIDEQLSVRAGMTVRFNRTVP